MHCFPYWTTGPKPITKFAHRVQESLSEPLHSTFATGNISNGATGNTFPTAKYFQPHANVNIGTPAIAPTELTYQPFFLFDYPTTAALVNGAYPNLGTDASKVHQRMRISGHMEYTLRNQTNDHVPMEMIRWTLKKAVPRQLVSITENADPLKTTAPVKQGNILNLMGRAMFEQTMGSVGNAINLVMTNAEIKLKTLDLWNEYVDYKIVKFTLKAGKLRTFKVGRRMLDINTFEIFQFADFTNPITDSATWTQAFVPGATGLIFRQFGTPCTIAATTSDLSGISYSAPEILVTTRSNYTTYVWYNQPEIQIQNFLADSGITATANANLRLINAQEVLVAPAIAT
jgi:hypothetical protein